MILKRVHIKEYKCINDSTEFKIDEKVTCLVGKNESGKTAVLHALGKLNAVDPAFANFDDLEYPRFGHSEFKEQARQQSTYPITTVWLLSDADRAALECVIGKQAVKLTEVKLCKNYSNEKCWDFALSEQEVVEHLLDKYKLDEPERALASGASSVPELKKRLEAVTNRSARQNSLVEGITKTFGQADANDAAMNVLDKLLPRFAYFSEYLRMPGQISLNELRGHMQQNKPTGGDRVFLALLDMVGRTAESLEQTNKFESLIADLEGVSNRLTREIFHYWSQNKHLRVQFRFDQGSPGDPAPFNSGWIMRTRIENTRHGVSTNFDQRSAGFVWFFSFLVWFKQVKKLYGQNVILLLDEPGLSLHAAAQGDLLRYFEEKLAPEHQVIYTTHSPFMVDAKNLLRVRTVEDVFETTPGQKLSDVDTGTKIGDDVLSTDRDTLFPLQASLGYELTQTLFIGPRSLLVEGPSDLLYILWFQRRLSALGRVALDRRWTVVPCNGLDKISAFLALFGANQVNVAVLTDYAHGTKKKVRDIRESKLIKAGHVFSADAYAGKTEADVEDIVGDTMYCELVNQAYGLATPVSVPATTTRITEHAATHFRLVAKAAPEFDHYRPAEFLTQQLDGFKPVGLDVALNQFETLFRDLNALL